MDLLKKENWWVWVLLHLITNGLAIFVLAAPLGVYSKEKWYANWTYWLIGILCCLFPALIMLSVFSIQITTEVAKKLEVPGSEIYTSPYAWLLCIIVPFLGWTVFIVMMIYLTIWIFVKLAQGNAEAYIK